MASHMKTTVEIPDDLLEEAKSVARTEQVTLRSLIEEGLRWVLSRRRSKTERFVLREAAVSGEGVRADIDEGNWDQIRDRVYEGRGS
jgi:metal-responsive CopG/Arc/MetJ family transcriptional regulator